MTTAMAASWRVSKPPTAALSPVRALYRVVLPALENPVSPTFMASNLASGGIIHSRARRVRQSGRGDSVEVSRPAGSARMPGAIG